MSVAEKVAALRRGLGHGQVPAGLFGDPGVHAADLREVFGRCWTFLAHESEIAAPGSFVRRPMGEDTFIVVRGRDSRVRVLLDACRHRGVALCRADSGTATQFRCPYHGWTYRLDGSFAGAPAWRVAYGGLDRSALGLVSPAQVAIRHGLVFATLDPDAPDLDTYLGDMAWYLDALVGLDPLGIRVLASPQRFLFPANWKTPAENFAGDDYHLATLHRSVWDAGIFPISFEDDIDGYHVRSSRCGHALSISMPPPGEGDGPGPHYCGLGLATGDALGAAGDLEPAQLEMLRRARVVVGTVFPNFSVLAQPADPDGGAGETVGVFSFRTWQPRGPDHVEMWNWFFGYASLDEDEHRRSYRAALSSISPAGAFEMDDTEPWGSVVRAGRSVAVEKLGLTFNYQMGLDPYGEARTVGDWPGPGVAVSPRLEEGAQRHFLAFYADLLDGRRTEHGWRPEKEER